MGILKQPEGYLIQFWGQKSEMEVLAGPRSLCRRRWRSASCPLLAPGVSAVYGAPWLGDAALLLASVVNGVLPCVSLCLHMGFLEGHQSLDLVLTSMQ